MRRDRAEFLAVAALGRLADAVERLEADYAAVHRLRITECPECRQPSVEGKIFHLSGCAALWPDPHELRIPGEGL